MLRRSLSSPISPFSCVVASHDRGSRTIFEQSHKTQDIEEKRKHEILGREEVVELQVAEGDLVVTRGTARGTHQGEYWGITFQSILPTGKHVRWTETVIDRIVDGKIAESWINEDALGRLQQLGALPTPEQAS